MTKNIAITDQMFAIAATSIIRDKFHELPLDWYQRLMDGFYDLNQVLKVNELIQEFGTDPVGLEKLEVEYSNYCATAMFQANPDLKERLEINFPGWFQLFYIARWCVGCILERASRRQEQEFETYISANSLSIQFSAIETQMEQLGLI